MSTGFNLQTYVDIVLFNEDLKGLYEYKELIDDKETTYGARKTVLVLPTEPEPRGFTLADFVTEANNLIKSFSGVNIDEKEIKDKLKGFGIDLENITVELRQLFVYMDTTTYIDKTKEEQKALQYAFNVNITNSYTLPGDMSIFKIKKIGIAIYKTDLKFAIDRMELIDINSLIG